MSVALKMVNLMYCIRFQCIAVHATKAGEKTKMQSRAMMSPRETQGLPASQPLLCGARTTLLGPPHPSGGLLVSYKLLRSSLLDLSSPA